MKNKFAPILFLSSLVVVAVGVSLFKNYQLRSSNSVSKNSTSIPNSEMLLIDKDYSPYFIFDNKKIIYDQKPVDYPGKIIISPNKKFACIEYGVSGYWGYHIFDLQKHKTILSGKQYSYCLEWSESNKLNVKEVPYNQSIARLYLIDPITLQKTVVK